MLDIKFQDTSLQIRLVDEEGQAHFLNFNKLYEKIEPEKSSFRLRSNKIIITLHKWLETKWKELYRPWKGVLPFVSVFVIMHQS